MDSTKLSELNICIVVPTRNESSTLEEVINELREAFSNFNLKEPRIIITDDSSDDTRKIAKKLGLEVIIGGGKGLGYAMQIGLKSALAFSPDIIMSMDADGQSEPREIVEYLTPIVEDRADLVIGSRFLEEGLVDYKYKFMNRFGVKLITWLLRKSSGVNVTDSHGALRAMRPEVVEHMDVLGTHTYVQETLIDAKEKGFRILEIPSVWRKRRHGSSKVVQSIPKYIMYTLPVLLIRSGLHVKWLYSMAVILVFSSFSYFYYILWSSDFDLEYVTDERTPSFVLIALSIMIAVQFFSLGLTSELLKNIKGRVDRLEDLRNHKNK